MTRRRWFCFASLPLLLLTACSAMGLADFNLVPCRGDSSPCDALNADLPEDQCERYYCHTSGFGCELRARDDDDDKYPNASVCAGEFEAARLDCDDENKITHGGADETYDRLDNDCDGFVDEGAQPRQDSSDTAVVTPSVTYLSHSSVADNSTYLAVTRQDASGTFGTLGWMLGDGLVGQIQDIEPAASSAACESPQGNELCNFGQLAIAADSGTLWGIGINRAGCGDGQVRVGTGTVSKFSLNLGFAGIDSNVRYGVDISADRGCSLSSQCPGAREPVIAALPATANAGAAQGIALWLAPNAEQCAHPCLDCEDSRGWSVAGLGLWVDKKRDAAYPSIQGTSGGHSELIAGHVTGEASPSLVGWPGNGYFAAYAGPDALELVFIPALPRAPSPGASLRAGLLTQVVQAEGPQHASLAIDPTQTSLSGLAVAWLIDDGADNEIMFGEVAFSRDAGTVFSVAQQAVKRGHRSHVVEGPLIVYSPHGFSVSVRGKHPPEGGWFVVWIEDGEADEPRRVVGARIAQNERHQLGDAFELARGAVSQLFSYAQYTSKTDCDIAYGYVEGQELHVQHNLCAGGR